MNRPALTDRYQNVAIKRRPMLSELREAPEPGCERLKASDPDVIKRFADDQGLTPDQVLTLMEGYGNHRLTRIREAKRRVR